MNNKKTNLYNKYRPKCFSEIIGQDLIKNLLLQTFKQNKLLQSFLFYGSHGTGKTSLARVLAKAWNCPKFKELNDVCNECDNCKLINEFRTTDIYEIDAASHSGVEHVRELIQNSHYVALNLDKKIYIIDECHNLSSTAWNVFLKTIEEPSSENIIFIFLTTNINKIPDTILSRCQKYSFSRLDDSKLFELMNKVCKGEKRDISDSAKKLMISLSNGSARDCLSHLEQVFLNSKNICIEAEDIENTFRLSNKEELLSFISLVVDKKISEILQLINKLVENNKHLFNYFSSLVAIFLDLFVYKNTFNASLLAKLSESEAKLFLDKNINYLDLIEVVNKSLMQYPYTYNAAEWAKVTAFNLIESIGLEEDIDGPVLPETKSEIIVDSTATNINKEQEEKPKTSDLEDISVVDIPDMKIFYAIADGTRDRDKSVLNLDIYNKIIAEDDFFRDSNFTRLFKSIKIPKDSLTRKEVLISTDKTILVCFEELQNVKEFNYLFSVDNKFKKKLDEVFMHSYEWIAVLATSVSEYKRKASKKTLEELKQYFDNSESEEIKRRVMEIFNS